MSKSKRVLYLGDGAVDAAAAYLLGVGHRAGFEMHHLPSDQRPSASLWNAPWDLLVLSDYPATGLTEAMDQGVAARVQAGMGLWMIGGWASFHGQSGRWNQSKLHMLLPVEIQDQDDRVNCDGPAVAVQQGSHRLVEGLPFDERPPGVGGYNRVRMRSDAELVLGVQRLGLRRGAEGGWEMEPAPIDPLLALGVHGAGRCVAWMTDVAPHWVGGWVDWGSERVVARHPASREVEVGADYAKFLARILDWASAGRSM